MRMVGSTRFKRADGLRTWRVFELQCGVMDVESIHETLAHVGNELAVGHRRVCADEMRG